jgi:histidinol phosphatase-like PHP family hydrolase
MTLEGALRKSRKDGLQYGITTESTRLKSDAEAAQWLSDLTGKPVFSALLAEDDGWTRRISHHTAKRFDYVLADSRIWKDGQGRPLRLSNPTDARALPDPQTFVESLLDQTVKRLDAEPIDIYAHPTYLPPTMSATADELWTKARITKLIDALLRNKVAIELNTLDQLPSERFIRQAKDAGCKFALGTANATAADLKRCQYGLQMIQVCKLDWQNFFVPGGWWPKATERRWPSVTPQ